MGKYLVPKSYRSSPELQLHPCTSVVTLEQKQPEDKDRYEVSNLWCEAEQLGTPASVNGDGFADINNINVLSWGWGGRRTQRKGP